MRVRLSLIEARQGRTRGPARRFGLGFGRDGLFEGSENPAVTSTSRLVPARADGDRREHAGRNNHYGHLSNPKARPRNTKANARRAEVQAAFEAEPSASRRGGLQVAVLASESARRPAAARPSQRLPVAATEKAAHASARGGPREKAARGQRGGPRRLHHDASSGEGVAALARQTLDAATYHVPQRVQTTERQWVLFRAGCVMQGNQQGV